MIKVAAIKKCPHCQENMKSRIHQHIRTYTNSEGVRVDEYYVIRAWTCNMRNNKCDIIFESFNN